MQIIYNNDVLTFGNVRIRPDINGFSYISAGKPGVHRADYPLTLSSMIGDITLQQMLSSNMFTNNGSFLFSTPVDG